MTPTGMEQEKAQDVELMRIRGKIVGLKSLRATFVFPFLSLFLEHSPRAKADKLFGKSLFRGWKSIQQHGRIYAITDGK